MSFFRIIRSKLENLIFTEQFIREDRNVLTRIALKLFYLSGGFCFDRNIRTGFKKVWIAYNIFSFVIIYASSLIYFIKAPVKDYFTLLLPLPLMAGIVHKFTAYAWTYITRDTFAKLFAFLNQNDHNTTVVEKTHLDGKETNCVSLRTINLKKIVVKFIAISCGIVIAILAASGYENYIKLDDFVVFHYPVYIPADSSSAIQLIIRLVQIVTILPEMILFIAMPSMLFIFGMDIYNSFVFLAQFLRSTSNSVFGTMEHVSILEVSMEEKTIPSTLTKLDEIKIRKALAMDEYLEKLKQIIKRHQELRCMAEMYTKQMKYVFSLGYFNASFTATAATFVFVTVTENWQFHRLIRLVPAIVGIIAVLLSWIMYCYIGQKFQEMNEMIAAEVYSSPWYYLEPKDRKLVLTFLSILQRPMKIVVCELYTMNLSLFPVTVNTMYSQMQILRTLQKNKQKLQKN